MQFAGWNPQLLYINGSYYSYGKYLLRVCIYL